MLDAGFSLLYFCSADCLRKRAYLLLFIENKYVKCLQQWNAHFFLLTATKLYYTDETSVFSQNDNIDEDEDVEEKEEEDNVTNAHMEVLHSFG